jgi:lipopolysaccharide transport system permease protein
VSSTVPARKPTRIRSSDTYVAEAGSSQRTNPVSAIAELVGDLRDYRYLLYQLTLRDIRIRYKQAAMGFAWAILMPLLIVGAGVLVRYAMAYLAGGQFDAAIISGLAIKSIPWAFFVSSIQFASGSLVGNMNLVTKIYFPREVLPISATLAQAFDSAIGAVALAVLLPLLGVGPSAAAAWAVPIALCLILFTIGTALLVSCANLFFRDVKYIVRVLLTFGIFFTPVFFEPAMFGPVGATVMMFNPLAPILEGLRLAVVEGHNLWRPLSDVSGTVLWSPWYLLYAAGWALGTTSLGAVLFRRLEFLFAEYI